MPSDHSEGRAAFSRGLVWSWHTRQRASSTVLRTGPGVPDDSPRSRLMGWSGRAPASPAFDAGKGRERQEHAMSDKRKSAIAVIGIDIGKYSFHIVGLDERGAIVLRQKWSRSQVDARLSNMPPCLIGMEACVGAHHLSRRLRVLGHDARLMPAKYVRPYSKGQKNDFRDAEAIAEAVQRPTMKFVATKTAEQLDRRRPTACVSGWSVSALASSIRSAPSCWNEASPCDKTCASYEPSYHAFSPHPAMSCRRAWCT